MTNEELLMEDICRDKKLVASLDLISHLKGALSELRKYDVGYHEVLIRCYGLKGQAKISYGQIAHDLNRQKEILKLKPEDPELTSHEAHIFNRLALGWLREFYLTWVIRISVKDHIGGEFKDWVADKLLSGVI